MMNLKGNLDLVLDELANLNETEAQTVHMIREKMQQYTMQNMQNTDLFEKIE